MKGRKLWTQHNTTQSLTSDKNFLLIFKNGKFYNVYNDDAFIFYYLFGYKILKDDKVGFPESGLVKVLNTIEDKKINYQIIYKDRNPIVKKYDKLNNYHKILGIAINYLEVRDKVTRLKNIIDEIDDYETLERLIEVINNELKGR